MKSWITYKVAFAWVFLASAFSPFIMAEFTRGSIDMLMQTPQGDVNVKLKISPKAVRSEIQMGLGQIKMDMTFLIKLKENTQVYQINDAAKTYTPVDLGAPSSNSHNEKVANKPGIRYANIKVDKLGKAKILGYAVDHLKITSDEFNAEIWLSPEIGLFSTLQKLQKINRNNSVQLEIFSALESHHHKGFPMKMWWQEKGGERMEMHVSRVKKEALPENLFEIPKGYTQSSSSGLSSPQNINNIKNILENMSPEQKEALKKMMQGQKGPSQ